MELLNIPQTLYKYRIWDNHLATKNHGAKLLIDNEVYLASANKFNDPFDCSLPFKYSESDLTPENIRKKVYHVYIEKNPLATAQQITSECEKLLKSNNLLRKEYWRDFYTEFKKTTHNTFGILSLSARRDNILMWSHYANSHKGFCVGFDSSLLFKSCFPESQIGPVLYNEDNSLPLIGIFEEANTSVIKLTMTKSIHWKYEEEYRIVKHGANTIVHFPSEAIKEIIVGCNIPDCLSPLNGWTKF